MKNMVYLLILAVIVSGCVTLDAVRTKNRENINSLSIGMTKSEVLEIMGTETQTAHEDGFAYHMVTFGLSSAESQKIPQPYKTEILQGENKTFEVLYYYTDIKNNDMVVNDNELTPLVFDGDKLIGWGLSFLQDNLKKYDIAIE